MPNLVTASSETEVLELDLDKCAGYGNCVFSAPQLLDLDLVTNLAVFVKQEWSEQERSSVAAAVADCPAAALRLYRREE